MKRSNFFVWYYDRGIHECLQIWENFLHFFWRYFSMGELVATLFYPWHRDVTPRTWRGWNPAKSAQLFFENIFSRVIGAIVRLLVIAAGLATVSTVLLLGLLLMLVWIAFPLVAIVLLVGSLQGTASPFFFGGFIIAWTLAAIVCYIADAKSSIRNLGFADFSDHTVSQRICGRLGIEDAHFLARITQNGGEQEAFLKEQNMTQIELQDIVRREFVHEEKKHLEAKFWLRENLEKIPPIGNQWRYGYTVHLDQYATDLSSGDWTDYRQAELFGRQEELEVLKLVLVRPDQNCALLVGNSGIGKKTMLHHFARMIRRGTAGEAYKDVRILLLDLGRAVSDSINRGKDVENVMRLLFHEAAYAGNVILAIEHVEQFLGKEANTFHPDLSAVIGEYLGVPSLRIIATSTPKEYHQLIEKEGEIVKYFEVIELREPDEQQTLDVLFSKADAYERNAIIFTYEAFKAIIRDSNRYNWQFPLPERAIDLMMDVLMYWEKNGDTRFIFEKTVSDFISLKTGIPQGEVTAEERKKLLDLEKVLHKNVIGQEEAVKQVAEALRRARSGIGNSGKPIGSFLFLGPTGVGKTETAKALALAYFGDEKKMIRLDMSEFQSPNSIDRLIGSSQMNQQGRLVTAVKDNPYSLVLLDEIEKAYPEILNLFLQVLDEGFLTDAFGEKINFRNTIIIATSNAGAPLIKDMVAAGQDAKTIKQSVIDYTVQNGIYRVEFLNRFNGVIFFRPLNDNELKSVVGLLLKKFARRLAKEKNIDIEFTPNVVDNVIAKGYNPIFGARSLNRYIEDTVEDLVATKIIAGEVKRGEKITISL